MRRVVMDNEVWAMGQRLDGDLRVVIVTHDPRQCFLLSLSIGYCREVLPLRFALLQKVQERQLPRKRPALPRGYGDQLIEHRSDQHGLEYAILAARRRDDGWAETPSR